MEEPLIELRHIYKIYQMGDEEVRASDDVSLTICRGEFVAVVGKSGSGKSTLMNIIGALDVPTEGEYLLGGEDTSEMSDDQLAHIRNKMIGFIFQQYNLLPKLNLLENVELPLLYAGVAAQERRERAMESLRRVGLEDKWKNLPAQLSGGQQQRVSIARAIAAKPAVLLADEPTGNLDSRTSAEVMGLLKMTSREFNQTIIMITHNDAIAQLADRVIHIEDGKLVRERKEQAEICEDGKPVRERKEQADVCEDGKSVRERKDRTEVCEAGADRKGRPEGSSGRPGGEVQA